MTVGTRRSYEQFCGLATALDVVGERWTLLIVRDLGLGPLRYGELLSRLGGIGDSMLSQRLRHLEAEGIVRRTFSQEHGGVVYELTDDGQYLLSAIVPLARWGMRRMPPVSELDDVNAEYLALLLASRLDGSKSAGVHERYELRVDGAPYTITADDGHITVERGAAIDAVVRVALDLDTFMQLGMGRLSVKDAREKGLTKVEGDKEAVARYTRLLTLGA